MLTHAFGREEDDRYVLLVRKEYPLSDEEMEAYKKGEEWDEDKAELLKLQKAEAERRLKEEQRTATSAAVSAPNSNYKDKYHHIIGKVAAKDAAIKTKANSSFGMVPSKNKRDQRSIEETLNDIAKKRRKPDPTSS